MPLKIQIQRLNPEDTEPTTVRETESRKAAYDLAKTLDVGVLVGGQLLIFDPNVPVYLGTFLFESEERIWIPNEEVYLTM